MPYAVPFDTFILITLTPTTMRKSLFIALLVAFALPFTAQKAQAQGFSFIPYAGYNFDAEDFLIGVGAEFDAPFSAGTFALGFRPSIEYVFAGESSESTFSGVTVSSSVTFLQINGDLVTRLNATGFSPFVGAGLAIAYASFDIDCEGSDIACDAIGDEGDSNTDIGLNVLGGLEFPGALAFGDPFVQARLTLADGSAFSILGGLSIPLGAQ